MKKTLNLQLFAEETATETGTAPENTTGQTNEPATEPKGGKEDEKKYSDKEVNDLLGKKFAEWQKKKDKEIGEAQKLATMNATQKAEYERDQLQKELDKLKRENSIAEMSKTARKILSESNINIPDELLSLMVTTDAEETKSAVDSFSKLFKDAVESAVKERLKGETPKKGSGTAAMTKEQIMAIKDPELRQKKMLENKTLFNF
jgi:hypothetical protein